MKIIIFERKRKNDDLSELFGNIRQDATDVFFYSVTDCRWLPLAIFGTDLNLYYPSISASDMVFNTAEVIYYDVLDELIEVAGDYIPPEYLFGLSVAYDYQSKHNEAVAELSEKAFRFFMGSTLPTLAFTGKAMGSAAPSLVTPAGVVVEGGTAVTGAIVVTGELVLALVSWAASGGNSSAAERNKDISEKLQDKANEKWAENSGAGKGGNSSWNKGSFDSPQESLEYHFKKHGEEVGAKDVDQYARKAEEFAKDVKKGSTKSYVRGEIEGVIRYKKNGKYIDIAPDGTIISFGKQ